MRFTALCLTLSMMIAALNASSAQAQTRNQTEAKYLVFTLPTLGGTVGAGNAINNLGWVMGDANLPGDQTQQAALWIDRKLIKLGTLGGPNSDVPWPSVKNNKGLIVGVSDTSVVQPLGEVWSCALAFFTTPPSGNTCQGFLWQDGIMSPIPTLGGDNGVATGINNLGQAVGWAETTAHDTTCNPPQVLQFKAYIYNVKTKQMQILPPFGNDPDDAATAINDKGQVVGISGICSNSVGGASAIHAVLWENGTVTNLGNIGGMAWNTPTSINNHGDVVGFGNTSGDQNAGFSPVAFLWTKSGRIQNLGTLPGDSISIAWSINNKRQIVGQSIGPNGSRAFIYQNGVMTPLSALTGNNKLTLVYANDINDDGVIVGGANNPKTGKSPAFMAVPLF
jgi:probable HAF family extracellular repeat protein